MYSFLSTILYQDFFRVDVYKALHNISDGVNIRCGPQRTHQKIFYCFVCKNAFLYVFLLKNVGTLPSNSEVQATT